MQTSVYEPSYGLNQRVVRVSPGSRAPCRFVFVRIRAGAFISAFTGAFGGIECAVYSGVTHKCVCVRARLDDIGR
jgi:hypothetical protein